MGTQGVWDSGTQAVCTWFTGCELTWYTGCAHVMEPLRAGAGAAGLLMGSWSILTLIIDFYEVRHPKNKTGGLIALSRDSAEKLIQGTSLKKLFIFYIFY